MLINRREKNEEVYISYNEYVYNKLCNIYEYECEFTKEMYSVFQAALRTHLRLRLKSIHESGHMI